MRITKKRLADAGFEYRDLGDEVPYEIWKRDEVEIWCFNGKHWLVDALDQGGIGVEFKTMEHLNEFWLACRLPPVCHNIESAHKARKGAE